MNTCLNATQPHYYMQAGAKPRPQGRAGMSQWHVYTLTDPRTGRDALGRYRPREGVL